MQIWNVLFFFDAHGDRMLLFDIFQQVDASRK